METEGIMQCLKEPATGNSPEEGKSNFSSSLLLSFYLRLGLSSSH
jgi:hypothetical protein